MKVERDWIQHRTLGHAGDFLGIAFASGQSHRAADAASFVLETSGARRPARELAGKVLLGDAPPPRPSAPQSMDPHERRGAIRSLKIYLQNWPRDALAWIDLARHYTILAQRTKAVRAVAVALALAPTSRFVILAASRFYLTLGEADVAHHVLRRCPRVKFDPWMLAAEIALTQVLSRTSDLIKTARRTLNSGDIDLFHVSELACALGTIEMEAGSRKAVRRLFKTGLADPTENAIAQAEWVSRSLGLSFEPQSSYVERQYEADAWSNLFSSRWQESIDCAQMWLWDEPFSSRPAKFGSWVPQTTMQDYATSARFARAGLQVEPKDALLLNNLAVCLANLGQLAEAQKKFAEVGSEEALGGSKATYLATKGLLKYRLGEIEEGRLLYRQAAAGARNVKEKVWALLHHAKEECRVDPDAADAIYRQGCSLFKDLSAAEETVAQRIAHGVSSALEQRKPD